MTRFVKFCGEAQALVGLMHGEKKWGTGCDKKGGRVIGSGVLYNGTFEGGLGEDKDSKVRRG